MLKLPKNCRRLGQHFHLRHFNLRRHDGKLIKYLIVILISITSVLLNIVYLNKLIIKRFIRIFFISHQNVLVLFLFNRFEIFLIVFKHSQYYITLKCLWHTQPILQTLITKLFYFRQTFFLRLRTFKFKKHCMLISRLYLLRHCNDYVFHENTRNKQVYVD